MKNWTKWVLLGVTIVLAIFDIWIINNEYWQSTISAVVLERSIRHPIIPFVIGIIAGHLFWPQRRK